MHCIGQPEELSRAVKVTKTALVATGWNPMLLIEDELQVQARLEIRMAQKKTTIGQIRRT